MDDTLVIEQYNRTSINLPDFSANIIIHEHSYNRIFEKPLTYLLLYTNTCHKINYISFDNVICVTDTGTIQDGDICSIRDTILFSFLYIFILYIVLFML